MKKKRVILAVLVGALVISIVMWVKRPRDYELTYEVDGYQISENYDKGKGYYAFSLQVEDIPFSMVIESKYLNKRELIDEVDTILEEGEICVLLKGDKIEEYPVCYKDSEYVDYGLIENYREDFYKKRDIKKVDFDYQGVEMKCTLDKGYFIWNYRGYFYINGQTREKIDFLEKESYYNNLAFSNGEYLLTPNYDQDYSFTEFYVLNMKNGKVSKWKMDIEISFNAYYLGINDGLIYMVDRKNKAEYEIDPKRKRIERVDKEGMGRVFDGKWNEVSMTKLTNDVYTFEKTEIFDYTLDSGALYISLYGSKEKIRISNQKVDKLISSSKEGVFYLVKDEIYYYSPYNSEILILKYSELGFNNVNSIFIY